MPHHVILWLQFSRDLFLLPKTEWNKFDLQPQFFVDLPNWNPLSLSVFQHLSYCNFHNFWKCILKKNPSLPPPPLPFVFIHFVERNVNGELRCLWVSVKVAHCELSFPSEASATFSAALPWLSATAKGLLQIYPSGGFRPVFSFVLGFLFCSLLFPLFFTQNRFFKNFTLGQFLITSWYFYCI